MKFSTDTDVSKFDPEQRDSLLAEMEQQLTRDWREASNIADRKNAAEGLAAVTQARFALCPTITKMQRARERDKEKEAQRIEAIRRCEEREAAREATQKAAALARKQEDDAMRPIWEESWRRVDEDNERRIRNPLPPKRVEMLDVYYYLFPHLRPR